MTIARSLFSNSTFVLLEKMLDATWLRNKVIANNIANVNTPGFRRSDVSFEDELKSALKSKDINRLIALKPRIITPEETVSSPDLNNVDIDMEMARLAENTLLSNIYAQFMSGQFAELKLAIRGQ